jgi:PAS domain S-box-containing protein
VIPSRSGLDDASYRSLFDHHPDAVYFLDRDGRFAQANPTAQRLLGIPWHQLEGQSFVPFVVPEFAGLALSSFRRALAGEASHYELAVRTTAGRRIEMAITNVPLMSGNEVTGVFGIARDLTEQRELEAQLRQAQRIESVGKLAGGIAHDFNNLITAIKLHGELLLDITPPDDERHGDLQAIQAAADRAAALTRQLLAFSRRQLLRPEPLDVNEIVRGLSRTITRLLGADITVRTDLCDAPGMVMADPGQVEQVLVNLLLNARDAMPPEGGRIVIETRPAELDGTPIDGVTPVPGAYVQLSVSDNGAGMDAAVRARAFEPFFTTKAPGEGTGLGLSTVYGIVKQTGGYVFCESRPGTGTSFRVFLPRTTSGAAAIAPSLATTGAGGTETVLLVEDEPAVRALTSRILQARGYRVLAAADGREALDLLTWHTGAIDLVLTDAVMPGIGGAELARLLKHLRPGVPVLFMSGYTDDEIIRRGIASDPGVLLQKPFTADELARRVRAMLDAPKRSG